MSRWLCVTLVLFLPAQVRADPLLVDVLSTHYSTHVSADLVDLDTLSAEIFQSSLVSSTPLANAVITATINFDPGFVGASASADFLNLALATSSGFVGDEAHATIHAVAWSEATTEFAPTYTGVGGFTIDIAAGGSRPEFSSGSVRLIDLTTSQELSACAWYADSFFSDMPWILTNADPMFTASIGFEGYWDSTHRYALTMFGATDAEWDNQTLTMQVTGIRQTPEPGTLLLTVIGFAVLAKRRGWRPSHEVE